MGAAAATAGGWVRGVGACAAVLAVVLAGVVVAGSGGAAAAEVEARRAYLRDVRQLHPDGVTVGGDGAVSRVEGEDVTGLLGAVADRADATTFALALRLLGDRLGIPTATSTPVRDEPVGTAPFAQATPAVPVPPIPTTGATEGAVSGGGYGRIISAVAVGDLTGDGLEDVLRIEGGHADDVAVVAVRGLDGEPLWTAPLELGEDEVLGGTAVQPAGDVTGDGLDDVLLSAQRLQRTEDADDGCTPSGCSHTELFTWTIEMRSGADGAVVWAQAFEGSSTFGDVSDGRSYAYESTTVNAITPYQPLQDVTGDGVGDFLLTLTDESYRDAVTVEGTYPGPVVETSTSGGTAATELRVVSGSDGTTVESMADPRGPTTLSGRAVPDIGGDGTTDLLLTRRRIPEHTSTCTITGVERRCESEGVSGGLEVTLVDAPSFDGRWTASFPVAHGGASSPGDLTGDGVRDVVVDARSPAGQAVLAVLDGPTGDEVWLESGEGAGSLALTPLQDDDALDVLAVEVHPRDDGAGYDVTVVRRDGATGAVLSRDRITGVEPGEEVEHSYVHVQPAGDADADGTTDLLVFAESFVADRYELRTSVVSGRTGEVLAVLQAGPHGWWPHTVGDLDGDGGADALVQASTGEGEDQRPVLRAIRLRDGAVLWERLEDEGAGGIHIGVASTAQLTGGPGTDLLVAVDRFTDVVHLSQILALDGQDGAELWVAPPPPEVTRVAAGERIGTAVALSAATRTSATAAVLARADLFPDALAGGPLASALDAPLLLTGGGGLDPQVRDELARLGAGTVLLLGGEAALGPQVAADAAAAGLAVERIGGADRYATAAAVAERTAAAIGEPLERVAVAAGGSGDAAEGWTDAILASAYAAGTDVPMVLVAADAVPAATAEALQRLAPTGFLTLVGGGGAVSGDTEQALQDLLGIDAIRLAAESPAATSRVVADFAIRDGASPRQVLVATAERFPDALAATAAVGAVDGVLLLTAAGDGGEQVLSFLTRYGIGVRDITLVGGPTAVSPEAADAIAAAVGR